jgi:flagellar assembly protein FliH
MLAKFLKSDETRDFMAFTFPDAGEATGPTKGVNEFVFPNFADFEFDDDVIDEIDLPPMEAIDPKEAGRVEAERIIAQAEENSILIEQIAKDKAAHEIALAVESQVAERMAELRGRLTTTIDRISGLSADISSRVEKDLVDLAIQIAKKIITREVTIDHDIALNIVRISLAKLHDRAVAEVHLNPDDLAYVNEHREALDFRGSLDLVEDSSISVGGCLIHTDTGDIDARIESQFDEIAHGLFS